MEYVTIILAIIEAIRECLDERRKESEIVAGMVYPGFVERLVIRREVRGNVRGARKRREAYDKITADLASASRRDIADLVSIAATGNGRECRVAARKIAQRIQAA